MMDNFNAFDKQQLQKALDPFLPGAAEHTTPISYLAYNPDIFLFLFRLTDPEGVDRYFVLFQYDHIEDEEEIKATVKSFIGVEPEHAIPLSNDESTDDIQYETTVERAYKAMLFIVPRPKNLGYWSENIVVQKGDDLDKKLKNYTPDERAEVAKVLMLGSESRQVSVYRRGEHMELFYSS